MSVLERAAERLVRSRLSRIRAGCLLLRWQGETLAFGDGGPPHAEIQVHDSGVFTALALGGHVGAAEAYVDGAWTSDDLTAVVRLFLRNREVLDDLERGAARLAQPLRALAHRWNRNTRGGARRNIRAHYDLGNDFFAAFLDETLTYSAGVFDGDPQRSMRDASLAKYDRICRKLGVGPEHHVLEIGSGWGGFAIHAAERYGCRVTTTTVSRRQRDLAEARVREAGLSDRVTVLCRDYRDLDGSFDRLVSIEMIEAVGHQYYRTFFERCAGLLAPHGLALLQAITIQDRYYEAARREVDFIKRYIFPGSCIPSVSVLTAAAAPTDLRLVHMDDMTPDYAETLRRWRARFLDRWQDIRALGFDESFKRLWDFYFCYCEGGFEEAVLGSVQMMFAKPEGDLTSVRGHGGAAVGAAVRAGERA
ncbi:MAG: cyclopropane-fatty-acyl-phospholipid synthase family protein [Gemmatimonadota bacterium]|nr:cyclopropane-fatty-acyl-phospholipid synthase family protein [Gemmatimonadota bacterium]